MVHQGDRLTCGDVERLIGASVIPPFSVFFGTLRRHRHLACVLACWFGLGVPFTILCWCCGYTVPPAMNIRDLNAPENELGVFSLWRLAGSDGRQPGFRIGGSNLRIENARHGFVNTPLHKTAVFEDLNVKLYCYSEVERIDGRENVSACVPDETLVRGDEAAFDTGPVRRDAVGRESAIRTEVSSISGENQEVTEPFRQVLTDVQQQFTGGLACLTIAGPLLDIRRASKAVAENLDYGVFYDGQLRLGVKCGRAVISESASEVCLERGVTLTGEGGQRLVSSRAVWDVKHGLFEIPGPYVLTRDGRLMKGHGICCDSRFNIQRGKRMAAPKTALFRRVSAAKPAGYPPVMGCETE